jgi:hypothetical protein
MLVPGRSSWLLPAVGDDDRRKETKLEARLSCKTTN